MTRQNDLFLSQPLYCFDSSSLILLRKSYPKDIDIFSSLHDVFIRTLTSGKIVILDLVFDELKQKEPELYKLLREKVPKARQMKFENYIYEAQRLIRKYYDSHGQTHKLKADPHVIACAQKENVEVITDELNSGTTQIPYVCIQESVKYDNFIGFLRKETLSTAK